MTGAALSSRLGRECIPRSKSAMKQTSCLYLIQSVLKEIIRQGGMTYCNFFLLSSWSLDDILKSAPTVDTNHD